MQISRIRLSDKTSRLHPRHVVPKPAQAYEWAQSYPDTVERIIPVIASASQSVFTPDECAKCPSGEFLNQVNQL